MSVPEVLRNRNDSSLIRVAKYDWYMQNEKLSKDKTPHANFNSQKLKLKGFARLPFSFIIGIGSEI